MTDREKVMQALECLANGGGHYDCLKFPCPYEFYGYTDCKKWMIARDALALLKEQEPVKPAIQHGTNYCGACGNHLKTIGLNIRDNYCGNCGRRVKWDDEQTEND